MGLNTAGAVRHRRLGFGPAEGVHYVASNWNVLAKVLDYADVADDDVFMDAGCGKGAVICRAMEYPFRRVIGLEKSQVLADIAQRNVAVWGARRGISAGTVEIVTADASTYDVPDDVSVIFMFNPFTGAVFDAFLDRVLASMERSPRTMRIVYNNPVMHERLVARGFTWKKQGQFVARPVSVVNLYCSQAPA